MYADDSPLTRAEKTQILDIHTSGSRGECLGCTDRRPIDTCRERRTALQDQPHREIASGSYASAS